MSGERWPDWVTDLDDLIDRLRGKIDTFRATFARVQAATQSRSRRMDEMVDEIDRLRANQVTPEVAGVLDAVHAFLAQGNPFEGAHGETMQDLVRPVDRAFIAYLESLVGREAAGGVL